MDDMSAVAAGLAATAIPGIGKKLSAAPFLPMFFHTLSGDGINSAINRSFRITLKDDEKIKRAEADPKLKMSLCFRWYLSKSSSWANNGLTDRALDYQVWCGPAMGAFNQFIKGTYMGPNVSVEAAKAVAETEFC